MRRKPVGQNGPSDEHPRRPAPARESRNAPARSNGQGTGPKKTGGAAQAIDSLTHKAARLTTRMRDALHRDGHDARPTDASPPAPARQPERPRGSQDVLKGFVAPDPSAPDAQALQEAWELRRRAKEDAKRARRLTRLAKQQAKAARRNQKRSGKKAKHDETLRRYTDEFGYVPDRPVTTVPPLPQETMREVEFETIQDGIAYIRILYDEEEKTYTYEVIEPELTDTEQEVLQFLRETLYRTLDGRHDPNDRRDWAHYLDESIEQAILDHVILIDQVSTTRVKYYLFREFLGYGPVDVLMNDPLIEDISCDGPGIPIYVFHRQYESVRTNLVFRTEEELDAYVVRLAQVCGKHISLAEPLLDATLPDSSRLQATLSREVTTRGSSFTVRRFRADPLTTPDLIRLGTMSAEMAAFFWLAMEAGQSIIYAGGTASGKTTTLNAVCQFIPPEKKIVSIEDTREINLRHENWIASVARPGYREGGGHRTDGIDMYRLLEAALRQRPEFLLVGEVRGAEAKTLFQAMATGHATYSTLHADSAMSAVYRLENNPINIPRIMLQTLDALAIQVQARLGDRLVRRIKELVEVVGIHPDSGDLVTNSVFRWDPVTDTYEFLGSSHILKRIMEMRNISLDELEHEWQRRARLLGSLAEQSIRHIDDVTDIIGNYYRDPKRAEARLRAHGERSGAAVPATSDQTTQIFAKR